MFKRKSFGFLLIVLHSSLGSNMTCDIDLDGKLCTLKKVEYNTDLTHPPSTIVALEIKETNLSRIPQNVIGQFPSLVRLDLSQNAFKELTFVDIKDTTLANLSVLDVTNNKITNLTEDVFTNLTNLKYLSLNWNQIQTLPYNVFAGLSKLERLDLSNNHLHMIQGNIFDQLQSLNKLELNNNWMKMLRLDVQNLRQLEYLFANNNKNLTECALTFASEFSVVINDNGHEEAQPRSLQLNSNMLDVLSIRGAVDTVTAQNNNIRSVQIDSSSKTQHLDLENNNIANISNITRLSSLTYLDLSGNTLGDPIMGDIFSNLTKLVRLRLVSFGPLWENSYLQWLDLSDNSLRHFDLKVLRYLPKLETLVLESNEIEQIVGYEHVIEVLPKLQTIFVSDNNQFSCSYLRHLTKALFDVGLQIVNIGDRQIKAPNVNGVKCIKDVNIKVILNYGIIVLCLILLVVGGTRLRGKRKRQAPNRLSLDYAALQRTSLVSVETPYETPIESAEPIYWEPVFNYSSIDPVHTYHELYNMRSSNCLSLENTDRLRESPEHEYIAIKELIKG